MIELGISMNWVAGFTFQIARLLLVAFVVFPAGAQEKKDEKKWDVNAPTGLTTREIRISVDEGTWINVDVSPDGHQVAFDLLGDIYIMPITGGTPKRLAEGLAYETQPRFSPDGKRIAFVSDRGGGDNIWVMNRDGTDKRQLTTEDFRLLYQPTWSPSGQFIAAKKHFTTQRSLGTGEIWLYHISGGTGVPLVKKPSEVHQKELGEPIFAPNGRHIYFTRNTTPGPIFEYAQDSNNQIFAIERYNIETDEIETIAGKEGGAVRPTPSPDGRKLAYVKREKTRSKLYVRDLETASDQKVYDNLDQDVQETWAVTGVYPNMAWTPDSRELVFWAGGKLRRLNLKSGKSDVIPFSISDTRIVIDPPKPPIQVAPEQFDTKMPRGGAVSPNGKTVVFETLGKLWIKPMSGGKPRRLTSETEAMEAYPTWSPDGKTVAFVRWTDAELGSIHSISSYGGISNAITQTNGHYARPRFSPDGRTIVFEKRQGENLVHPRASAEPGIYRVPTKGGPAIRIVKEGSTPHFGASNDRVFLTTSDGKVTKLVSTDLNGTAQRTHAEGELVNSYLVSPDERHFAFRQNYQGFVMPLLPGSQAVSASSSGGAMPVTQISKDGADWIHWSSDGAQVHWSLGPTLYSADRKSLFADAPLAKDAKPIKFEPPKNGLSLSMRVKADKPSGRVAFVGARIVTMADTKGGIIENGVVLVEGNRIALVGDLSTTRIPVGVKTVDVKGKTIIPGLIDAHAHGPYGVDEFNLQVNWSEMANLALGVTTQHDPSSRAALVFPSLEMVRAGRTLGPRSFSTGEIVYGSKSPRFYAQINSKDDALAHIRRLKAQGAHSIKNYNQPRRDQRQQVVAAAIEENIRSVAEGGSLYGLDITLIADGNTTLEHNLPLETLYNDVLQFVSRSKVGYTPTLVVTYGGLAADPYWRSHTEVYNQPLLRKHIPEAILFSQNSRRAIAPEDNYVDDDSAREAAKLARLGVPVAIGGHGQHPGIAAHWELWSFVRGGMTPIEALRAGTIESARSLGYDKDIGSIERGKLADLVILDADPTSDIRNSEHISKVMLNGRLFDAATLNEEVTGKWKRPAYWWESSKSSP